MKPANFEKLTAEFYCALIVEELTLLEKNEVFCPSVTDDNEASPIAGCHLAAEKYLLISLLFIHLFIHALIY